jgi:GlcNAc-P-P-Und epimerase
MKIAVIGGSGFIGSSLCSILRVKFRIIDKNRSKFFPEKTSICDIRNRDSLFNHISRGEILVNLAAEHRDDVYPKSLYHDVNVDGAKNICEIARLRAVRNIIFTSSVAVYGFARLDTDECGTINPFNDYGRTKWEAENIYKTWQAEDPKNRILTIIRPTVVFGERNRGNVFNLLKQIAFGNFIMIGSGRNRKSMAYVENVAGFIKYSLSFKPGVHIYNYIDKPDYTMNSLVTHVNKILGRSTKIRFRLPYFFGLIIGGFFDFLAFIFRKKFTISSIRIKKFCANSVYSSAISLTGFKPPVNLIDAIERTVKYEFLEDHQGESVFFSE